MLRDCEFTLFSSSYTTISTSWVGFLTFDCYKQKCYSHLSFNKLNPSASQTHFIFPTLKPESASQMLVLLPLATSLILQAKLNMWDPRSRFEFILMDFYNLFDVVGLEYCLSLKFLFNFKCSSIKFKLNKFS